MINDIVARLRVWSADESTWDLLTEAAADIERLRARVDLLSGYLRGALSVIERFVSCDTEDARAALEGEKADG